MNIPLNSRKNLTAVGNFLKSEGFTGSLNDILYKWLRGESLTGSLPDMFYKYLRSLGHSGSFPDMLYQWGLSDPTFNPLSLFANGEEGAWYEPYDISTLFQDAAGTTPVTASGQPVGRMLDKSGNGNHATQSVAANRPIYRTGGGLAWLELNGISTSMAFNPLPINFTAFFGLAASLKSSDDVFLSEDSDSTISGYFGYNDGIEIRALRMLSTTPWSVSISGILSSFERHVLTFGLQSTAYTRLNGGILRSDVQSALSNSRFQKIGGFNVSSSQNLEGNLYSAIFVGGNQYSVKDVEKAEHYLANKSGVTL